jgi:DNA-3-methyladenine glycosylase II
VSTASATAIWNRLAAIPGATTPEGFLALGAKGVEGVGFSRTKLRTVTGIALAITTGELNLAGLEELETEQAIALLTKLKGVGPWTAEIYLMFCAGHPDIFPAGDLALQKAVGDAFGIATPNRQTLSTLARVWSPHRSTAALLFWRFYAARKQRQALPL